MKILITLIIIFCSGYYYSITAVGSNLYILLVIACIVMISLFRGNRIKINKNALYFVIFFELSVLISSLSRGIGKGSIKQLLLVFCALLIVNICSWQDFKHTYVVAMKWISILSIVGYTISLTPFLKVFPLVTNYNNVEYYSGGFFSVINYLYIGPTNRMHGIFWEPGLLATYEIFAILFLERGNNKKQYYFLLALFTISIILSKSGAGITLLLLVFIVKLFYEKNVSLSSIVKFLGMLVIAMVLLLTPLYKTVLGNEWINKYMISRFVNDENNSFGARKDAVVVDVIVGLDNLPFGVGVDGYAEAIGSKNEFSSSGTSTLTTYIAEFGILGFLIIAVWIFGLCKFGRGYGNIAKLAIIIIFVSILSKEPHGNLLFMNCILLYTITEKQALLREYNQLDE